MSKNSKPWWQDPKFIIPSILIPVLALFIPLLTPDKVTKKLSVNIEIKDPRRPNSFIGLNIENSFDFDKQSIIDSAAELSSHITTTIESYTPTNPEERPRIDVFVNQEQDGSLFIEAPGSQKTALHLTKFKQIKTLPEVLYAEYPSMLVQSTLEAIELAPPHSATKEEAVPGKQNIKEHTGVFRVALTAPGYHDTFIYISVSKEGEMLWSDNMGKISKVKLPIPISLYPNLSNSGQLTIAIDPFSPCTKLGTHQTLFEDIEKAIQKSLEVKLQQEGFSTFVINPQTGLDFHPYRLKNMPPPPNYRFSDFLIKGSCQWLE